MFLFHSYVLGISSKLSRDHVPLFESIVPERYTLTNWGLKIFDPRTRFSYPSYRELCDRYKPNQNKLKATTYSICCP